MLYFYCTISSFVMSLCAIVLMCNYGDFITTSTIYKCTYRFTHPILPSTGLQCLNFIKIKLAEKV